MNENPPLPPPEPKRAPLAHVSNPAGSPAEPLSKAACTGIGFLIFLVTSAMTYLIPFACLAGFVVAVGSLFYRGYRFIFVGYILPVGLLLLILIAYCSTHPFRMD